jgi:hypothetical protein
VFFESRTKTKVQGSRFKVQRKAGSFTLNLER